MKRRTYIERTGLASVGLGGLLAGCLGSDDPGTVEGDDAGSDGGTDEPDDDGERGSDDADSPTGTFATAITDQPGDIGDFESCVVTVTGAYVLPGGASGGGDDPESDSDGTTEEDGSHEETADDGGSDDGEEDDDGGENDDGEENDGGSDDESEEEGGSDDDAGSDDERESGRLYVEFEEPQEADLVDLQGTNTQLLDEREFEVGSYGGLHLEIEAVRGTLADGGEADVDTPGSAGLKFPEAFEVRENDRTTFVADFTPVRRGPTNRYLIRPVATGTAVLYGDEEYGGGDGEDGDTDFYELDDSESPGNESDDPDSGSGNDDEDDATGDDGDGDDGDRDDGDD